MRAAGWNNRLKSRRGALNPVGDAWLPGRALFQAQPPTMMSLKIVLLLTPRCQQAWRSMATPTTTPKGHSP